MVTPEASHLPRKKLVKLRKIQLYGAGGTGSEVRLGTLKLTIGSRSFVGEFVIAEMTSLRFAEKLEGILGNDLLTQFRRVAIDYKAHTLTLWEQ